MIRILETNRLFLRKFTTDDAAFILQLVNTPGWLEFVGDKNIKTTEEAKRYLVDGPLKSYQINGFGLSLVALKDHGTSIGMCGLIKRDTLENIDIGFAFLPGFSGMGYAYEIASAVMSYAKEELKLEEVVAITLSNNERSIRLLNKIGFRFEKYIQFPGEEKELMLYSNGEKQKVSASFTKV